MVELRNPIWQRLAVVTEFLIAILRLIFHSWRMAQLREEAHLLLYKRNMRIEAHVQSFLYATNELVKLERIASETDLTLQKNREALMMMLRKTADLIVETFDKAD